MSIQLASSQDNEEPAVLAKCLQYASLGWKLFPCHGITEQGQSTSNTTFGDSTNLGKRPATTNGHKDATSDPETIKRWWHAQPRYNIGVNCKASGFFVIDIDPRHGGDQSFSKFLELLGVELPETVTASTGEYPSKVGSLRGRHLYFRCDPSETLIGNLEGIGLPGIDIKFNGYVIVPPSSHSSGVEYSWVVDREPWAIPIATAPEFLLNKLRRASTKAIELSPTSMLKAGGSVGAFRLQTAHDELKEHCRRVRQLKRGERNSGLNAAAYSMGRLIGGREITLGEVVRELTAAAREVFTDEGGESEIASILRMSGGALESGAAKPRSLPKITVVSPPDQPANPAALTDDEYLKKFNKINLRELWADESEEEWLVPGIICEARGHTWYSEPGIGKSLMIREMCACLAIGRSVFGFPALDPMPVLYIDHENIPRTDIKRSLVDMGFSAETLEENFHLFSFPDFAPFDHPSGGLELDRVLDILNPRLVIIDTASRTVDGKENDNDTWINFYNHTGKRLKERGIAYIRIDHTGKNADAGPRGGSAKKGDVDLVWYLKEVVKEKKFRIINEKHRVPIPKDVYEITRELGPLMHTIITSLPWASYIESVNKHESVVRLIEDFVSKNPKHPTGIKALYEALKEECKAMGVSRNFFDEARTGFLNGQIE